MRGARTHDILVEDHILINDIIDQLARVWINDQHFPLSGVVVRMIMKSAATA